MLGFNYFLLNYIKYLIIHSYTLSRDRPYYPIRNIKKFRNYTDRNYNDRNNTNIYTQYT